MKTLWQTIWTLSATAILASAFAASASAQPRTDATGSSTTTSCDGLCISEQTYSDCEQYQSKAREYDDCKASLDATEIERDQEQGRAMELREQNARLTGRNVTLSVDLALANDRWPAWRTASLGACIGFGASSGVTTYTEGIGAASVSQIVLTGLACAVVAIPSE